MNEGDREEATEEPFIHLFSSLRIVSLAFQREFSFAFWWYQSISASVLLLIQSPEEDEKEQEDEEDDAEDEDDDDHAEKESNDHNERLVHDLRCGSMQKWIVL